MFTKILVALDGSELAERALPVAQNLSRLSGASIHLIQVISRQPEAQAGRGAGPVQAAELERDLARRLVEDQITGGKDYLEQVAGQIKDAGVQIDSSGPHHQDSGEAKIRESTAGVSRKPSSDCKACGCSSKLRWTPKFGQVAKRESRS